MKLKQILAQRKLRKLTGMQKHNPTLANLNSAKLIGVIWHPTQREAFHYLKDYFNKEKVIFRGFCVFEEGVNPQQNSNTLTTADLNWYGFPKLEKITMDLATLKENVQNLSVLDRLDDYRAVSFDWKSNGISDVGVIAQELYLS